ncbi:hypothetical protein [Xanthomonas sp. NCPPB 2632]|uniref:hypothetical protein n=1 Tax=Xanthomonas sp. NCPPB 2632 TaxID=3240912 RepID=UPI0035193C03
MFLSYFLWGLILPLALAGRLLPRRIQSPFLSDAFVYVAGVASVACFFGGFFAMLYAGPSTSAYAGYAGQEGPFIVKGLAVLVVLAVVVSYGANALGKALARKSSPAPTSLKLSGLEVSIEPDKRTVLIAAPSSRLPEHALAGRLVLTMERPEVYNGRIRMVMTELLLPHFFQETWTNTPHAKGSSRVVLDVDMPEDDAWAFKRWFAAHAAALAPDEAAAKKSWDARCAGLLHQCREQRQATRAPVSEEVSFGFGPSIDYAVTEADGRRFVASGDAPTLHASPQDGHLSRAFG